MNILKIETVLLKKKQLKNFLWKTKRKFKKIRDLCEQFISADMYVIAAPMWSLSFPAPLKEYIDCIVQDNKTIKVQKGKKPKGLLDDKYRALVYVQSSGGNIPWILDPVMDKGENYIESIMKIIGIATVEELKVDNTGTTEEERRAAIEKAKDRIDITLERIGF